MGDEEISYRHYRINPVKTFGKGSLMHAVYAPPVHHVGVVAEGGTLLYLDRKSPHSLCQTHHTVFA